MSYFFTFLISISLGFSTLLVVPFETISKAFEEGDSKKIMQYSGEKTLIKIGEKEGVYGKSQGIQVLEKFFKENPPEKFKFNFKGKSKGNSQYASGTYTSSKNFRVGLKFKIVEEDFHIEAITIE